MRRVLRALFVGPRRVDGDDAIGAVARKRWLLSPDGFRLPHDLQSLERAIDTARPVHVIEQLRELLGLGFRGLDDRLGLFESPRTYSNVRRGLLCRSSFFKCASCALACPRQRKLRDGRRPRATMRRRDERLDRAQDRPHLGGQKILAGGIFGELAQNDVGEVDHRHRNLSHADRLARLEAALAGDQQAVRPDDDGVKQPELANAGAEPRYVAEIDAMTAADPNLGNQSVHRMRLPTLEAHGSRLTFIGDGNSAVADDSVTLGRLRVSNAMSLPAVVSPSARSDVSRTAGFVSSVGSRL